MKGEGWEMEGRKKETVKVLRVLTQSNREINKERAKFSACLTDGSLVGWKHLELNAAIQASCVSLPSQIVALGLGLELGQDPHMLDHDPANSVLPPHRLPRAWPKPASHGGSQPEDTTA